MKHSLAKRDTDCLSSLLPSLTELTSVRNLGFVIDQELNMDHITKLCQSCYYQLRQIRTVQLARIISHPNFGPCFHLHASRFVLQPSLYAYLLDHFQSVLNSAACLILGIGCNTTRPSLGSNSVSYSIQTKLHHE